MSYAAQSDMQDIYGIANVISWSQLNETVVDGLGNPTIDASRVAKSLLVADDYINLRLQGGIVAVPIVISPLPVTITDIAARLAGWWLYTSRGFDETTPMGKVFKGQMGFHRCYVDEMLTLISMNGITGTNNSSNPAATSGQLEIGDLTDASGNTFQRLPFTVGPNYWPW